MFEKLKSGKLIATATLLTIVTLGGAGLAQQHGMYGMGGMWGMGPEMGGGMMMQPGPMHQGMRGPGMMMGCFMVTGENGAFPSLDERFGFLKIQLGITDAQRPQWDGWTGAVKRSVESTQVSWQMMWANMMNLNFAERFSKQMEAMNKQLSAMQEILPALSALYGVLTPEQRTRADMMFSMMGCHW